MMLNGRNHTTIIKFDTSKTSTGSSTNAQVKLPIAASGLNLIVDWGDGYTELITGASMALHTYSVIGVYTITIFSRTIFNFSFGNTGDRLKILEIKRWGMLSASGSFFGCSNLILDKCEDIPYGELSNSLNNTYRNCSSLTTIANLSLWRFKPETSFSGCFYGCSKFNDAGFLKGTLVKSFSFGESFYGCTQFNQDISVVNFDKNIDVRNVFFGKSHLNYDPLFYSNFLNKLSISCVGVGRTFIKQCNVGTIKYDSTGSAARAALIVDGWTIIDGGLI